MIDKNDKNKCWNLKKHLILAICLILFYIIFIAPTVSANKPLSLKVGVYENPPKIFTGDKGNALGFWPDIIEYIALQEGWQIEWVWCIWSQCMEKLENKEIDLMPDVAFTEPRSKKYTFSKEIVLVSWSRLYARKGANIETILDLEGKKIGVLAGSVNFTGLGGIKELTEKFDLDCTFMEMNNYTEVFEALEKGEIDAGVTNKDFGNKHEKDFDIERTPIIFQPAHMQFAFPKNSSLTPNLLEKVDYHMNELKKSKDSIYYQSLEKWLTEKVGEKEVIPGWVNWFLISIGGLVLLLVGGNHLLRNRVRAKTKELREEITERRRAEKLFKKLFYNSPNAIFILQEGKFKMVNPQFESETGYIEKEISKLNIYELIHPDDREMVRKIAVKMLKGQHPTGFEYKGIRKTGEERLVFETLSSITYQGKRAVLGNFKDITELRQVEKELKKSYKKLQKTMDATIDTVSKMIEAKDPYTAGHQHRVSQLASRIAKELKLPKNKIEGIRIASLIHDIGKIGLPAEILSKPTKLNDVEYSLIRDHSQVGYDILKYIDFSYPIAEIVLQHHERLNGLGYPQGLKADKIMTEAKIIGVADVVEAMSSHRPYRPALGVDAALEEISQNKGILYDPEVVDACHRLFKEKGFKFE